MHKHLVMAFFGERNYGFVCVCVCFVLSAFLKSVLHL